MRHRVGTTVAATVAIHVAQSAPGDHENTGPHSRNSAAACAARCSTAEPGRRGERPQQSRAALTGARARRRPPLAEVAPPFAQACLFRIAQRATRDAIVTLSVGHHAGDCRAALGPALA
jgi:hypothetical protein